MKKSSKKQLKPLYQVSSKGKDRDEKVLESMSSNNYKNNKITSSTLSKPKKSTNVFPQQNYTNINKSHLNSILNDSNFNDKVETSKIQNNSMIESQVMEREKTHTNVNNTQLVDNINDKISETPSIKHRESIRDSYKESIRDSYKGSIKERESTKEREKDKESNMSIREGNTENNIETMSRNNKSENIENNNEMENNKTQKEIVEAENEDKIGNSNNNVIPESDMENRDIKEEEAANDEDE